MAHCGGLRSSLLHHPAAVRVVQLSCDAVRCHLAVQANVVRKFFENLTWVRTSWKVLSSHKQVIWNELTTFDGWATLFHSPLCATVRFAVSLKSNVNRQRQSFFWHSAGELIRMPFFPNSGASYSVSNSRKNLHLFFRSTRMPFLPDVGRNDCTRDRSFSNRRTGMVRGT